MLVVSLVISTAFAVTAQVSFRLQSHRDWELSCRMGLLWPNQNNQAKVGQCLVIPV